MLKWELREDNEGEMKRHQPRFVFPLTEPHPDRLLNHDAGAGPVNNLVFHWKTEQNVRL